MQLKKIEQYIQHYKNFLKKSREYPEAYKWESLQIFQKNWDIDAPDFGQMYNKSLENSFSRRLWKGDNFDPKTRMLQFIALQPDFVRRMFRDLMDESKEHGTRSSRFLFGCEELLKDYKTLHRSSIENNHYHENNHMISLYLGFLFPQKYALFFYPEFKNFMIKLGSTKVPATFEVDRFYKILRTLNNFLLKDEELLKVHQRKLNPSKHYMESTLLLAQDFYETCGREDLKIEDF